MNKISFIGIGASATVGKDTLFKILDKIFPDKLERVGLADNLKLEMDDFCRKRYGISAFTKDPKEKELIRPIFVAHGKVKRFQTRGTYWTSLVQPRVEKLINDNLIPVCTDIRYSTFPEDEIFWLKNKNSGTYIHVNRFGRDGQKIEPANSDEREQESILEKYADFRLNWQTSDDENFLVDTVKIQLAGLINNINLKYANH